MTAPERILIAIHDGKIYGHNPPEDAPTHTYFHASHIAELEAENAQLESALKSIESAPRHARLADHDLVDWMVSAARAALDEDK